MKKIDVSIIIVNYNSSALVNDCISSIFNKTEGLSYEIIVVDNATENLEKKIIYSKDERLKLLQLDENVGFGRANNAGSKIATGRNLFLLNPDTLLRNNAIKILSNYLDAHPKVGVVGGNLYNDFEEPIHSYRRLLPGVFWDINEFSGRRLERWRWKRNLEFNLSDNPITVGYITGADLMIRKSDFEKLGGFDRDYFMYFEETDLIKRMKKTMGKKCVNVPAAEITHLVGKTIGGGGFNIRKRKLWERGRRLYMEKNHGLISKFFSNLFIQWYFRRNSRDKMNEEWKEYHRKSLQIHYKEWSKSRKKVVLEPMPYDEDGSFLARFAEALRRSDDVWLRGRVSPRNWRNVVFADWIVLNWWEDEYFRRGRIKRWIAWWLLRLSRAKKAIVFHNKESHENTVKKKTFYKRLLEDADKIILLSESSMVNLAGLIGQRSAEEKGVFVRHPNYNVTLKCWDESRNERLRLLFFGFLRPYKNVELLIQLAKKHGNIDVTIAGESFDEEYGKLLEDLSSNVSNLRVIQGFLSDDDISRLVDEADILCLPYNVSSSQNSGVAIYAFSKGINVVIPEIETIKDLKNKACVYTYLYESQDKHFSMLDCAVKRAEKEFLEDFDSFRNKAKLLNREIIEDYSLSIISNQLRAALWNESNT